MDCRVWQFGGRLRASWSHVVTSIADVVVVCTDARQHLRHLVATPA
jgi:hypothetical protein